MQLVLEGGLAGSELQEAVLGLVAALRRIKEDC